LRMWDVPSGQCVRTFQGHASVVMSVAFSPDGRFVVSGSDDNTLRLWNVQSGQCLRSAELLPDGAWCVIEGDERLIEVGGEAWRFLGWTHFDPTTQHLRLLPLEHFGPVPWSKLPSSSPSKNRRIAN
jgi:WD40 repeat protein